VIVRKLWVWRLMLVPVLLSSDGLARAQSSTTGATKPRSSARIPPPRQFGPDDAEVRRIRSAPSSSILQGSDAASAGSSTSTSPFQGSSISPSVPTVAPLPIPTRQPPSGDAEASVPPPPPARFCVDTTLIPGRPIEPIDLATALKLAGVRDLDIAIARQRVAVALAGLSQARALWLPSLFIGPTWYRADGQIQTVAGQVETIDRSGLFLGASAALANTFPGPPPGTGIPSLNGLSATLRISDAIIEPMAARRIADANRASLQTATNDAMLRIAEAYFDLQNFSGQLAIAREAAGNAEQLSNITGSYARLGQGLEADHRRALAELKRRRKDLQLASGRLLVSSANLVRLLVLDARMVIAPVEPAETIIRLIPDDIVLDDLVVQGLRRRPELANAQEIVEATLLRLKQARLRPLVPSVALTFAGGGFGGGQNGFFGNFGPRGDTVASLFWDLRNLGFTDCAIMRRRSAEHEVALLEKIRTEARVAAEIVGSYEARQAANRQITEASQAVIEALDSLKLNFINIRQGAELPRATRPIEVLQPIQALAQARLDYLDSVLEYNRSQFRLNRAIGRP
jgi:outer membrane protein TolC